MIKKILNELGIWIYKKYNCIYTIWERPYYSDDVVVKKPDICLSKDVGIVIQGPLVYENNFTLETIKLYKKLYPLSPIVVSTWNNENKEEIKKIQDLGVSVVINDFPEKIEGVQFINLQRETALQGIKMLTQSTKCKYIIKSRTDERIYAENALQYLIKIHDIFPLKRACGAKGRIVSTSMCSFRNRLYNVSDLFIFGLSEDVLLYFSPPYDKRVHKDIIEGLDIVEYSKQRPGEIYFASHYLETIGHNLCWTREDSDFCFKEYFIIIDAESLDLYWAKHTNLEYRWRDYYGNKLTQLTFKDWLCI